MSDEQQLYIQQLEEENKRLKLANKGLRRNNEGLMEGQKKLERRLGSFKRKFGAAIITFSGINRQTEEETTWTINSYEEILKEWWNNDGANLMWDDEIAHNIAIDGVSFPDRPFSELMDEINIRYWAKFEKRLTEKNREDR